MSRIIFSYYDYLIQNRNDPVWDAVRADSLDHTDRPFLRTVSPDADGFSKMVRFLCNKEVELSWLFEAFLDSWSKYYKHATGQTLIF